MESLDWVVVGGYFAALLGVAWWVIARSRETTDDYFLAGRNLGWFIVGASIFSSNIGSEHLVGLAGSGATDGVALAHYELHAWCLLILGWVMVPFYARSLVYTTPEFLERRFGPTARWVLSIISLVAYIVTKIAVGIFAGGIVFSTLLPEVQLDIGLGTLDSFWIGSILVILLTGTYTVLGGLRAVAYTETMQTVILIIGSLLVTVFGLAELGGWSELRAICGSEMFNLWKPLVPEGVEGTWAPVLETGEDEQVTRMAWYFNDQFPWIGMLLCAPIIGLWYWCTDQYIVQRTLGARDEQQARRGTIFAAFLKLLPVFIFIVPGMICFALGQSGKMTELDDSQKAFPQMVLEVLPTGVRGIVVAGLLSALMSSLAGVFNASSTLFTMDFYRKFAPEASQAQLVWIGRIATATMVAIGLLWVPVIQGSQGLYGYLQGVQGYLAPPIAVVFFLGICFKRLNAAGCLSALVVGFLLGILRLGVDTPLSLNLIDEYPYGSVPWLINKVYFQYYSLFITAVSILVMVAVSLATKAPNEQQIAGLTFGTLSAEDKATSRSSWTSGDVIASGLVLVAILLAYLYFRG